MVIAGHYFVGTVQPTPGTLLAYATRLFSTVSISGVDLFFVLSGFLIGGILLDNRDASNYFSSFYIRRVCRIFPIYYLWLALFLALTALPISSLLLLQNNAPLWSYFLYFQNFMMIADPSKRLGSIWLGITWSLAIEEQFYLTAPLLIRKLSRISLVGTLFFFLGLGVILRFVFSFHLEGDFYSYVLTFTRLDGLILGIFSALLVRSSVGQRFIESNERLLILAILAVPLGIVIEVFRVFRQLNCLAYLLLAVGYTAFLLIAITHSSNYFSRITRNRLLQHVGLLAYGLYIYHQGINGLLHWFILGQDPVLRTWKDGLVTVTSLLIVYLIARLSWALIERPMIQIGHRVEYKSDLRKLSLA